MQARAFLASIRAHRLYALFAVAIALGLRKGEILGLSWSDVELEAGRLHVRRTLQRVRGDKGARVFAEPKSERSRRTIELPQVIVDALKAHRVRQLEERLAAGGEWRDSGLVFAGASGDALDEWHLGDEFHALLAAAGLPRVRFHDLRHSCASFLLAQGVSARAVMDVLGHSQISLTLDTYSHVLPGVREDAAEKMDQVLRGSA
jgi:integrase